MGDGEGADMRSDVGAEHLDDEADDGIRDAVEGDLFAGVFAAPVVPKEEDVEEDEACGLEELAWVDGQGWGGFGDEAFDTLLVPDIGADGVGDAEGSIGASAVAAALEEAPDASDGMSEGEGRDDEVEEVEGFLVVDADKEEECDPGAEQSAIEHEAALMDIESGDGVGGEFGGPMLDDIGGACASDARDDEQGEEIGDIIGGAVGASGEVVEGPKEA